MALLRHLLLIAMVLAPVLGDDRSLDDFSNDLATDLGPLLALFGENMAKQYLSESTTFLDYFIFAMAPIGILTAMISTIRICGSSALRAFIGRAQEGHSAVEAELCTSTSRDVCELFNNGSITRVLGSSGNLEIVYTPGRLNEEGGTEGEPAISLLQPYIQKSKKRWEKKGSRPWFRALADCLGGILKRSSDPEDPRPEGIKPGNISSPNLSINVGIKRLPLWAFQAVACIGFFLQAGVVALANIMSLQLQWTNDEKPSTREKIRVAIVQNPSPALFTVGTVFLAVGMFWCAALVGEITEETHFHRRKPEDGHGEQHLFWLQPGGIRVGDQTFQPFAYFDESDPDKRLSTYTVSRKNNYGILPWSTLGSISITMAGYVLQFIGLRGMVAYVSLAQLGAIVVMSFLRGLLRMNRIDEKDNQLRKYIDNDIDGHELDWLAFAMERRHRTENRLRLPNPFPEGSHEDPILKGHPAKVDAFASQLGGREDGGCDIRRLVKLRALLGEVTGNSLRLEPPHCIPWEDERVKVRSKARDLGWALSEVAQALFIPGKPGTPYKLGVMMPGTITTIDVKLWFSNEVGKQPWTVDQAQIEAILGIRLWSLLAYEESFEGKKATAVDAESKDDRNTTPLGQPLGIFKRRLTGKKHPKIEEVSSYVHSDRIQKGHVIPCEVFSHGGMGARSSIQMWLGAQSMPEMVETCLWRNLARERGLWKATSETEWEPQNERPKASDRGALSPPDSFPQRWLFGWNLVRRKSREVDQAGHARGRSRVRGHLSEFDDAGRIQVLFNKSSNSLLEKCSQELFAELLDSMVELSDFPVGRTTRVRPNSNPGDFRFENPIVDRLAASFIKHRIGSYTESILCTIPVLHPRLEYPEMQEILHAAGDHLREGQRNAAERLLQWGCNHYSWGGEVFHDDAREGLAERRANLENYPPALRVLVELGELCRIEMVRGQNNHLRREAGLGGISWMLKNVGSGFILPHVKRELRMTLEVYKNLSIWLGKSGVGQLESAIDQDGVPEPPPLPDDSSTPNILCAIRASEERSKALYLVSHLENRVIRIYPSEATGALIAAARRGWFEVTVALWELGVEINACDENGRCAISHSSEVGALPVTEALLQQGALPDIMDRAHRSPLSWAAANGRSKTVKALVETGEVDVNSEDTQRTGPLAYAVARRDKGIVGVLLEAGARAMPPDGAYQPLYHANMDGQRGIYRMLTSAGADAVILRKRQPRSRNTINDRRFEALQMLAGRTLGEDEKYSTRRSEGREGVAKIGVLLAARAIASERQSSEGGDESPGSEGESYESEDESYGSWNRDSRGRRSREGSPSDNGRSDTGERESFDAMQESVKALRHAPLFETQSFESLGGRNWEEEQSVERAGTPVLYDKSAVYGSNPVFPETSVSWRSNSTTDTPEVSDEEEEGSDLQHDGKLVVTEAAKSTGHEDDSETAFEKRALPAKGAKKVSFSNYVNIIS
ncbi:hypothetical protein MKZ38_002436 [Zalerion maritima]|uniref:Ankyrin repeat protein n=1 Tax=Zalerion maritima TaxID=339359 RepID=A0AAD5RP09_9PEZI|nr:hypothetical protein MKZ38_002436 [Zalerion maritima]